MLPVGCGVGSNLGGAQARPAVTKPLQLDLANVVRTRDTGRIY